MVTLQPSAVSAARDNETAPLLASTPPGSNNGNGPGIVVVNKTNRKARLSSLRTKSPRLPRPLSPTPARTPSPPLPQPPITIKLGNTRVSPPALLIRSATADCMGSPPGVDTVVTITDTEQVQVAIASPSLMSQLRTPPDLRVDFFSEVVSKSKNSSIKNDGLSISGVGKEEKNKNNIAENDEGEVFREVVTKSPVAGSKGIYLSNSPPGSPQHSSVVVTPASGSSLELPNSPSTGGMKQPMPLLQQLPDVANQLTLQELHDFEMKYGSPHHSRSQSVKTVKRPNFLSLPQQRSRVASMPNTGNEEEYYRLRHFSITGKGIVNRGDSLKSRRSKSNTSVASSNSSHSTEHLGGGGVGGGVVCLGAGSYPGSARTSAEASLASSRESSTSGVSSLPYRVVMLGAAGVGKSSLISQFMTSEYLHAYDTSLDDEFGEQAVSVLLDGEESELSFIDHPTAEMSPENCITTYEPHAYVVVYSVADRASMTLAEETLQFLWKSASVGTKAVILVGNKTDLVRSRVVTTEEGKTMATSYDCKFIETSIAINHNVDELLVGILTQIRLKLQDPERSQNLLRKRSSRRKYRGARTTASLKVKGLLGKVWCRDSKSKSCENLHVL